MFLIKLIASFLTFVLLGCGSASHLSEQEKAKLDPSLQRLLADETQSDDLYDVTRRPTGEKEYGVIVRTSNPEELRSSGVHIGSVFGDVVTARLTISEIRKVISLPSVRAVETGSKNYPQ